MTCYVGLTDDPNRRREEHGNPRDWYAFEFASEAEARAWYAQWIDRPHYHCSHGDSGWKYGYWFTITPETRQ